YRKLRSISGGSAAAWLRLGVASGASQALADASAPAAPSGRGSRRRGDRRRTAPASRNPSPPADHRPARPAPTAPVTPSQPPALTGPTPGGPAPPPRRTPAPRHGSGSSAPLRAPRESESASPPHSGARGLPVEPVTSAEVDERRVALEGLH